MSFSVQSSTNCDIQPLTNTRHKMTIRFCPDWFVCPPVSRRITQIFRKLDRYMKPEKRNNQLDSGINTDRIPD